MTATTDRELTTTYRGAYDLTEEQDLFRRTLREFGEREIVPIAHELDEKEEFPRASISKSSSLTMGARTDQPKCSTPFAEQTAGSRCCISRAILDISPR